MVDFAKPDSLIYRAHYFQQRRKKRKSRENEIIQRYFTDLTAAGGQYYDLGDGYTLSSDFNFSIDAEMPSGTGIHTLLSGLSGNDFRLVVFGSDHPTNPRRVEFVNNGVFPGVDDAYSVDLVGKLVSVRCERVGTLVSVYINDILTLTTNTSFAIPLAKVGAHSDALSFFFTGVVANLKITDNGTLVGDYPLDENWASGNVAVNRAAVLGSEVFVAPYTLIGDSITDNGDGSFTNDGTNTSNSIAQTSAGAITSTNTYLCSFTVSGLTSGGFFFNLGDETSSAVNSDGVYEFRITAGSARTNARTVAQVGTVGAVSNISIKQIPSTTPYATAVNITSDDAWLATQDGSDWLGG